MTNNIKRYSLGITLITDNKTGMTASEPRIYDDPLGRYVEYGDYELLKIENEWLKSLNKEFRENNQQWQPIKTAPTKTWIIVLFPNERPMTFIFMDVDDKIDTPATHWMPLPKFIT